MMMYGAALRVVCTVSITDALLSWYATTPLAVCVLHISVEGMHGSMLQAMYMISQGAMLNRKI